MSFLWGRNKLALPPSPVPTLLEGNQVPSAEEAQVIRDFVHKLFQDLVNAAALASIPIDTLPRAQWPSEYRKVEELAFQHLRVSYRFIHKCPDETLEQIFFWTILLGPDDLPKRAAQRRISHVSRRWRAVVNSSPRLWGEIGEIIISDKHTLSRKREAHRLDQIQTHLLRSQSQPISFYFVGAKPASERHRQTMASMLDLLVKYSEKWEVVGLKVPSELISRLEPIRKRLPILYILSLDLPVRTLGSPPIYIDYFLDSPSLRVVETKRADEHTLYSFPLPRLEELHHLLPSSTATPWLADILLNSPNLLSLVGYVKSAFTLESPLIHQSLRRLHIDVDGQASHLLTQLNLPSLRDLSVHCGGNRHPNFSRDVIQLVVNSRCSLVALDIFSGEPWPKGILPAIFVYCPRLRHLTLDSLIAPTDLNPVIFFREMASVFKYSTPSPSLVSHLRQLVIRWEPNMFFPAEDLVLFLLMRNFLFRLVAPKLEVLIKPAHSPDPKSPRRWQQTWMALLAALNNYPRLPDSDRPAMAALTTWRNTMLTHQGKPSANNIIVFHRMLKEMEAFDFEERHGWLFYHTDIPHLLVKTSASFSLARDKKRASALLDKWKPTLRKARREWIFRDDDTLEYVDCFNKRQKKVSWFLL